MKPASIVCWKWRPRQGYRSSFGPETVNTLRAMVARNYPHPHRFICVTDDSDGIDPRVEIIPDWKDFAHVPSPHGGKNPSCYRRLRMFSPDIASAFGERFVSIDLDTVIMGDLTPIWDRPEDFVIWGDTHKSKSTCYNGSMVLMTAGARPEAWTSFDPVQSPMLSRAAGKFGSDQGWLSYCLGPGEVKWSKRDGVYSFRNDLQKARQLPENCIIAFFHGSVDPWSDNAQRMYPWVREHYHQREQMAEAC
jgi:hypothetical protein